MWLRSGGSAAKTRVTKSRWPASCATSNGASDAAQQRGLAEEPPQLPLVEADGRRGLAWSAARAAAARACRTRAPSRPATRTHLPRRRRRDVVVQDRREARELRDEVELAVREGQLGRAADLQRRAPGSGSRAAAMRSSIRSIPWHSPAPYSRQRWRK